jgi:hypothetical protein
MLIARSWLAWRCSSAERCGTPPTYSLATTTPLHGRLWFPWETETWRVVVPPNHVLPDLRGRGMSGALAEESRSCKPPAQIEPARLVLDFLEKLDLHDVTLVGNDHAAVLAAAVLPSPSWVVVGDARPRLRRRRVRPVPSLPVRGLQGARLVLRPREMVDVTVSVPWRSCTCRLRGPERDLVARRRPSGGLR